MGGTRGLDYEMLFAETPTPYVVLDTDFVMLEANRAYCAITSRSRGELLGRSMFEVFPANPGRPEGDGVINLRASLERARDTGRTDTMALQRYDIPVPGTDRFEERWWSPINVPVLDAEGAVALLLHRTEDVTHFVRERELGRARGEDWRRQMEEAQADLLARARELHELNARLREAGEREREIAGALQRAMLPTPPSVVAGVRVATRYRPAEEVLQVGGDFYDVVALGEHRVALSVGDVTGKGLPAAAVMGQLRSALTAATYGSDGPPQALEVLDLYARSVVGALGATVVQVDLDRALRRIRYARAGHLPPLAIGPEGAATFLEQAGGPPLATGGAAMPAAEVAFPAGATLVLYTDGLVERRRRHIDSGLAALAQAAGRHAGLEVEAMADAILHALLDDEPAPDDAVLVVARAD